MKKLLLLLAPLVAVVLSAIVLHYFAEPPKAHASASSFANVICDQFVPISIAVDTQIVTAGGTNQFIYICSYNLNAVAADVFSIVEGTGTTCATNTKAVVGATTAAAGLSLGATGSINYGGGSGAVAKTAVAGDNLCILRTTAGPLSGVLGWTSAPF